MKITSDYPGGNIIYKGQKEEKEYTEVFLEQDIRDSSRWWFYWNFRADSPTEGKIRFTFQNKEVVCPYGAAVSENGVDWHYDTQGYEDGCHFTYTFDNSGKSIYFAFSLPYQVLYFERFFSLISADSAVERKILAVSEQGRDIPLVTVGNGSKDVVFTARHHCCESTASYVLEGVIIALLVEYRELLSEYRFHIIPFMDIDGAENGDQGKARIPHDHNRDYSDELLYSSVRALTEYSKSLNNTCLIDFHSPWRWGGANSRPHIFLTSFKEDNDETENRFVSLLEEISEAHTEAAIKYDGYVIHYDNDTNRPDTKCADGFFKEMRRAKMSLTIETPYSGDFETPYSAELLRKWGRDIAEAFYRTFG